MSGNTNFHGFRSRMGKSQASMGCRAGHLEWCVSVCWGVGFPRCVWPMVQSGDHSGTREYVAGEGKMCFGLVCND